MVVIGLLRLPEPPATGTCVTEPPGVLCPRRPLCHVVPISLLARTLMFGLLESQPGRLALWVFFFITHLLLLPFLPALDLSVAQNVVLGPSSVLPPVRSPLG